MNAEAARIVAALGLQPHPEGGHYVETWKTLAEAGERPSGTAIYYLLAEGEVSHFHRVDADEIWHFYAGSPLQITLSPGDTGAVMRILGPDLDEGHRPQIMVPKHWWQGARSLGAWTLVGCTVSPGFTFAGFEMAPPGFQPRAS
jgi:hypothetical protein